MTGYVCIFEDGTEGRATATGSTSFHHVQINGDVPILTAAQVLNLRGRIVHGQHLMVGRGADDPIKDCGVFVRRGERTLTIYEPCRSIYLEADGTPSWVPAWESVVRYADNRTPTPADDFRHPQGPSLRLEHWHGEPVVVHQERDGWTLAESGFAPVGHTRILLRDPNGIVSIVWHTEHSFTSTPSQFALTPIGPIVAINNPNDGMSYFRTPSHFRPWSPYVPPVIVVPPPTPEPPAPQPELPKPPELPASDKPPDSGNTEEPPPAPKPKPWWIRLLEELLKRWTT